MLVVGRLLTQAALEVVGAAALLRGLAQLHHQVLRAALQCLSVQQVQQVPRSRTHAARARLMPPLLPKIHTWVVAAGPGAVQSAPGKLVALHSFLLLAAARAEEYLGQPLRAQEEQADQRVAR